MSADETEYTGHHSVRIGTAAISYVRLSVIEDKSRRGTYVDMRPRVALVIALQIIWHTATATVRAALTRLPMRAPTRQNNGGRKS